MPRARDKRELRALSPPPTGHENGHTNGHAALEGDIMPKPGAGISMPRWEEEMDLHPQRYPGWRMKVWINTPQRVRTAMFYTGTDPDKVAARDHALRRVVLWHNGWADDEGAPFPPANTPEFWQEIPTEVAGAILARLVVGSRKLGNDIIAPSESPADD